jgi:hypothetical protein
MRYPTSPSGLALPVQEVGFEVVQFKRRETNRHHLQFERNRYTSPLQRVFRGLCDRVVDMRIIDHNDLHDRYSAPRIPTDIQMIDCVEEYLSLNGTIDVVREKRTHEIYQIESDTWQNIKSQYRSGNGTNFAI